MLNKYKETLDVIEWSFSTANLYEQCPYAFYNKKICDELGIDNAYASIGRFAHNINEKIFKKEITIDEALNEWIENYEYNIFGYLSEQSKEKKYVAFCDYLAEFNEVIMNNYKILEVETKFKWKIGKYNCVGLVDLVLQDRKTGDILLIDHKSAPPFFGKRGKLLKSQADNFSTYSKQMYLYCKPIYEKYKVFPKKIIWNHMFDNRESIIDFNIEDYNKAQEWLKKIVRGIYRDKIFDAKRSYMLCNVLCNYREDCEYKNLEEGD